MEEKETPKQALERMGAPRVRILLATGNLSQQLVAEAVGWLAQIDESDRARNEASQASQMRTALSAKKAAWIAAIAAIIAAVIAIISIIVTYLSLALVH
jgi:type IV secretory pathway component VirB8